jgi:putative membrane-bound dehydrogenase-like protein
MRNSLIDLLLKSLAVTACGIGCTLSAPTAIGQVPAPEAVETFVLPRVPPKSLDEALDSIEVADGFRIELAAAEPLVVDPVAMAFDAAGRLYVIEMCDYSEQDKERLGKVRVLTDENGDGRYEKSRVFADGLSWPTAITCYDGGVFVGAAPDIFYLKDTDGDGRADQQRIVFTGFGRDNVQGLFNSFHWGLDHRIHGATSSSGGAITWPGTTSPPLDLRGRDFAFDPKTLAIEAVTGGGQHGMSFDRWGNKFVCSNSDHLQAIVFEERYLKRNPFQSVMGARRSIAADGPQAAVYRLSPVEAWRIARTKLRVAGIVPGPIEGGGQPAGYFTGATGVTIYEGGLWDEEGPAWAFTSDVGGNLIHRKRLVPDGVTYRGERVDVNREFVRSSDIWFRPVQMAIGPEGALYIADMYREVIEHPASLPPALKQQLDLTSGRDRGRIYRVLPADYRQRPPRSLTAMSTGQIVKELDDANLWRRMTALRLLYEQQDPAAAALLRSQLPAGNRPAGRIAVLYALDSLNALTAQDLLQGLADAHPQVRRHALRLSELLLDSSVKLRDAMLALDNDADPIVQFQLALTLGECDDPRVAPLLAQIMIRNADSQDIVAAALTSVGANAGPVLQALLADRKWTASPHAKSAVTALVAQIVKQGHEADIDVLVQALTPTANDAKPEFGTALLKAVSGAVRAAAAGDSPQLAQLVEVQRQAAATLLKDAQHLLERSDAPPDERLAAIENLGLDTFDNQQALLERLLSPQEPAAIHTAVLATCAGYDSPAVAELVLSQWEQFAPTTRLAATELLLRRKLWALALLNHLSQNGVPLTTLDPNHIARLVNYPNKEVNQLARSLRGQGISDDRQQVYKDYHATTTATGDPAQGKLVFEKNCATCHQVGGVGHAVGPSLASMANRGPESLLFNVLVPNGEVDPRFLEYVILTADGQVVTGIIAGETSTAVSLRAADEKTTTVLRVDIDDMHNSSKSLMPEGFERLIDKRAMADLLTYLQQAAAGGTTP